MIFLKHPYGERPTGKSGKRKPKKCKIKSSLA